jgi:hypothetical protein
MKNRNRRMREIAFHTLFCMVSMVSILLTMQKKYTSENDPLQAQITMREFQFFELIIEKILYGTLLKTPLLYSLLTHIQRSTASRAIVPFAKEWIVFNTCYVIVIFMPPSVIDGFA